MEAVLARQAGVISRVQAVGGHLTKHAWDWRIEKGVWQRVLPGIAVAHSGGLTIEQRRWAAALHGGVGSGLSGRAALAALGMRFGREAGEPGDIDVAVPLHRRPGAVRFLVGGGTVRVHRVKLQDHWLTTRKGLPLLRAEVAVLHAFAWAGSDADAEWVLAAAVQQKTTAVPRVRSALATMPELTRRALVREVLDDVELGAHAGSELRFLRFLRQHGLPLPDELQLKVRAGATHYLDARYSRQRLTIEVDGAHHRDVETWDADALRTLRVVAHQHGEQVIRITTGMLRNHAEEVARLLGMLLAARHAA